MEKNNVYPESLYGNGLHNPFTCKKTYIITCGKCYHTYKDKIPTVNDYASSICPCCKTQNTWFHSEFAEYYKKETKTC